MIFLIIYPNDIISLTTLILSIFILSFSMIIIILSYKIHKPCYYFREDKISYTKNKDTITIEIKNIKKMKFFTWKWYNLFILIFIFFLGEINYYTPSLYIEEIYGRKHELGYFSNKDIIQLKQLYGDLLEIK